MGWEKLCIEFKSFDVQSKTSTLLDVLSPTSQLPALFYSDCVVM